MVTKNILVVDPDEHIGKLVALLLGEEGYQVTTCFSLKEAVKLLTEFHFDLIITEAFNQNHTFEFDPGFLQTFKLAAFNTPIILFSTYAYTSFPRPGQYGLWPSRYPNSTIYSTW